MDSLASNDRRERPARLSLWTSTYVLAWLRAFVFTELVEAPIYRYAGKAKWRVALGASALTHPFVWFVFPYLLLVPGSSYVAMVCAAEFFAWGVEAFYVSLFLRLSWWRAGALSLAANGASMLFGVLLRRWTGYP